jgi:hypothetical protein
VKAQAIKKNHNFNSKRDMNHDFNRYPPLNTDCLIKNLVAGDDEN